MPLFYIAEKAASGSLDWSWILFESFLDSIRTQIYNFIIYEFELQ